MTTLGEDYPKEQERVRDLLVEYEKLPDGSGQLGAILFRGILRRADEAAIQQDLPAMVVVYQEMKECV